MKKLNVHHFALLGVVLVLAACNNNTPQAPAASVASAAAVASMPAESASAASVVHEGHDDDHNAKNSLDWMGSYEGELPCADYDLSYCFCNQK